MNVARTATHGLLTLFVVACGGNHADVPAALIDAVKNPKIEAGYPEGPYGPVTGDTAQNLCFQGWSDPKADGYDPSKFVPICFQDFHADETARLLLVESCAVWCTSCRFEYSGSDDRASLTDELAARQKSGFRVLGTLFQNATNGPAAPKDAVTWAKLYSVSFPFALDDQHQLGLYTSPNTAPFNLLVDTKTMKIVLALEGDDPLVLGQKIDDFLAEPAE